MDAPVLRTDWKQGPATGERGAVLVSVTDFTASRLLDMPGIFQAGLRLRREWPRLDGAVGMWLWVEPHRLRCGSVSVWESEEALHGFVAWPVHVDIMRRYRGRGQLRSTTWSAERFDATAAWREARRYLSGARERGEPRR